MNARLLDFLRCPETGSELNMVVFESEAEDIIQGVLISKSNKENIYPIVNGIPRMLPDALARHHDRLKSKYTLLPEEVQELITSNVNDLKKSLGKEFQHIQDSFSSEWEEFNHEENAWGQDLETRKELFLQCFDVTIDEIKGKTILDAGCGPGVIEFALAGCGAEIFTMDLSFSVDKIQERLKKLDVKDRKLIHLVQANVHFIPFKDKAFDFVHSAGVLHHTPSTYKGFERISRAVKEGGLCFIEVYSNDHKNFFEKVLVLVSNTMRKLTVKLPGKVLHGICYMLVPVMWLYTWLYNFFSGQQRYLNRSLKELELSIFDGLSPLYDWHHSTEEVWNWFDKLGFQDIKKTFFNQNGIGLKGRYYKILNQPE